MNTPDSTVARRGVGFRRRREGCRVGALLLACAGVAAPSALGQVPPAGEQPPAPRITALRFEGLERTTEAYARGILTVKEGDAADAALLEREAARLIRTGKYLSVVLRVEVAADGVTVTFQVRERPRVSAIRFEGNAKFRDGVLADKVGLKVDDPLDPYAVREGREAIVAAYREAGFGQVEVTLDEGALQRGEVIYTIEEGPRVRVRLIVFEGRQSLAEGELKKRIVTKTALGFLRPGLFDVDRVEGDVAAVQNHYRDEGFLDARVSYRVDAGEKPGDLVVVFTVEEGTRYAIEDIRFEGHELFSVDELTQMIRSRVGEYVKPPVVENDARTIQTRYGEIGYIYATVRPVRIFSQTPGLVIVTLQIEEKEQYAIGRVIVRGNTATQDKVVRRELNLFPPDDLFNLSEAKRAEDRLRQTRVFSSAKVTPIGSEPGVRDALIDVVEEEKAGDVIFGFGVTSDSGLVGSFVLDFQNFDLFDYPRSFSEFIRLRSFHGAGQKLRLEAQPGTEVTRFRIDFTEPYFLDRPIRFGADLYLFSRGRDGYDESRVGGNVSFGKRFETGWLRRWAGEVAFRGENVNVDDLDLFAARDIREVEGNNALTSVKGTLVLDRTDNRFIPSTGDRFRVSYEQAGALGGDFAFGELTMGYNWHRTVSTDLLDRKSIVSLRAESGAIAGNAPVFERFYAGGIGSIRGFQFRGVSPREGLDDNAVGGDFMLLFGAEYTFPVYGDILRGVLFTDMGTVEDGITIQNWRASVGVGARLTIEQLGPLPIEFDLALPVLTGPDDEEQVFSFFIGTTFF